MSLIKTTVITYLVEVPEPDIRAQLIIEAAERHGLTHEGKLIPGVKGTVSFDGRRGGGTYSIRLERNVAASGQTALPAPPKGILP